MAKVSIFKCDICQKEVRPDHWTSEASALCFTLAGGGPQMSYKTGDVCRDCGKSLISAFAAAISALKP